MSTITRRRRIVLKKKDFQRKSQDPGTIWNVVCLSNSLRRMSDRSSVLKAYTKKADDRRSRVVDR